MVRRGSFIAAALAAGLLLVAGCSSGDGDKKAQPSPSGTPGAVPVVGECHAAEPSALKDHRDPSPAVACTEPHTLETVAVVTAREKVTRENVGQHAAACRKAFTTYVGATDDISRLDLTFVVPSEAAQNAGQYWVRCDALAKLDTQGTKAESRPGSVRGILASSVPVGLRACLNTPPDFAKNQPYVSCAEAHIAELVPKASDLGTVDEIYPGKGALDTRAEQRCDSLVSTSGYPTHVGKQWEFPNEASWAAGDRTGSCWVSATLPAVTAPTAAPTATPTATAAR
jgi:hypothetical protein